MKRFREEINEKNTLKSSESPQSIQPNHTTSASQNSSAQSHSSLNSASASVAAAASVALSSQSIQPSSSSSSASEVPLPAGVKRVKYLPWLKQPAKNPVENSTAKPESNHNKSIKSESTTVPATVTTPAATPTPIKLASSSTTTPTIPPSAIPVKPAASNESKSSVSSSSNSDSAPPEVFVRQPRLKTITIPTEPAPAAKSSLSSAPVRLIELTLNDRLGRKIRVKANSNDTILTLKKLAALQLGTRPTAIRLQKWYSEFKDNLTLDDYQIHDGMGIELYYQ